MLKRIFLALGALLFATAANAAGSPVASYPDITSLTGTDVWYVERGGNDFHSTSTELATFVNSVILGASNTWTGTNAFGAASFSSTIRATGLSVGTQVSCVGLDSGNNYVLNAAACGSGGGAGTVNFGTAGQLGYYSGTGTAISGLTVGPTLKITGTTLDIAATVVIATTTTNVTTAQWAAGTTFVVTGSGDTVNLPAIASPLATNGGIAIQTIGQSVTLAPNAADAINGGTTGASVTLASGLTALVTTDGAGIHASPTTGGGSGGVTIGATITGSCTSGFNIYDNAGVVGCQANGGGGGTVTTTGTPAAGNLAKFSAATSIVNGDLSGDVTTTGTLATTIVANAVTTTKINNAAATYAKLQNGASNGLLGVNSGAAPSEVAIGSGLTLSAGTLSASGGAGSYALVGSTCNFNNTTTFCSFTGLTGSEYDLRCYGVITGNSSHVIGMQLATSGPTWSTGASDYNRQLISVTGASTVTNVGVAGNGMAEITEDASGSSGASFVARIHNLSSTSTFKSAESLTSGHNGAGYFISNETNMLTASGTDTAAIVGIRYGDTNASPVNMVGGHCSLYSVAN